MRINKETAVYEGIIDLIRRGADIYAVKVSDIAAAAGMGKGTVYDYFSSKEEMIAKAVIYCMKKSILAIQTVMEEKQGFREKFFAALHSVDREAEHGMNVFEVLNAGGDAHKLRPWLCGAQSLNENMDMIYGLTDELIEAGKAEGAISPGEDAYYNRMAVYSAIAGYCIYKKNQAHFCGVETDRAKGAAHDMLVRMLARP